MMDDQLNWHLFLEGDKKAFSEIFLYYHDDLFNYGIKLTANKDIVDDSIQELFLKLWKNYKNLKPVQFVRPYLFKALRHHILDNLKILKPCESIDDDELTSFSTYSPEDFMIDNQVSQEIHKQIIEVLNKLSPRQREAIYLRYFENLEFSTIAHIMGMNVQSVRNIIHRAIEQLRNLMLLSFFICLTKQISA